MSLKNTWDSLPANTRRNIWLGIVALAFFGVLYSFVSGDSRAQNSRAKRQELAKDIFTAANTREMGMDGLAAALKRMETENKRLLEKVETLQKTVEEKSPEPQPINEEALQREAAERALAALERKYGEKLKAQPAPAPPPQVQPAIPTQTFAEKPAATLAPDQIQWGASTPATGAAEAPLAAGKEGTAQAKKKKGPQMRTIVSEEAKKQAAADQAKLEEVRKKEEDRAVFLPAGSMVSGVLLTGMDAATSDSARRNPFPALLRIKKEAILPNRFRADVRECFLIASGYGDLSSERAYLRAETISCVRNDGGVIEAPIDMYASGEDGKAGVRGTLVSKQGQLVARSMFAGGLQAFSSVFTSTPLPTLLTTATETTPFQERFSKEALQSAGLQGFGSALERVAQFYMDMAENIFPIIEVDAGRKVNFIMTRGTSLKLR